MYRRMKRVGLIHGFIIPGYDALHSQSREHVTEDVLGALSIWEQEQDRARGEGEGSEMVRRWLEDETSRQEARGPI